MSILEILYCVTVLGVIALIGLNEFYGRKTRVPPVPTLPHVRKAMLGFLKKHLDSSKNYKIVELGSGWGGLSFAAARTFPQSSIEGYEFSPAPYFVSHLRAMLSRKNVRFARRDFLTLDLSSYDVVICYLSPVVMKDLKEKFARELKPGTMIVCNAFPIPDRIPLEQTSVGRLPKIPVFAYRI